MIRWFSVDPEKKESKDAVPAPRRRRSRLRRALTWTTLIGLVLFAGAVAISQTRWGEERARKLAERALHDQLGLDASIERVEVAWEYLPPALTLSARGIDIDHPEEGDFIDAEALVIRPSLGAFLRGEVDLESIEVDSPRIHLRLDEDGRPMNLPQLPESGGGGPSEFPFSRIDILNAAVSIDAAPLAQARLGPMDIHIDASGDEMAIDLRSRRGVVDHPDGREDIEELVLDGSFTLGGAIAIEEARLRTPYLSVRLSDAEAQLGEGEPTYRSHAEVEFNIAHLQDLPLGIELPPLEGRILVRGEVESTENGPEARGEVRVIDGRIDRKWGLGDEVVLVVDVSTERILFEEGSEARLISDGGRIALDGRIDFDEERGFPMTLNADLDMQFAHLIEQLGVTPDTPVWWAIRGEGSFNGTLSPFNVRGPLSIFSPTFLITVDPHHERPRQRVISTSNARIHGFWHVNEEAFLFENVVLNVGQTHFEVPVVHLGFDNTFHVEGAGRIDVADVSPLTTFDIAGAGDVRVAITGDFSDPQVAGHFNLDALTFDSYEFGNVESDWSIVRDYYAVSLPHVDATKGSSTYTMDDLLFDFTEHIEITGRLNSPRLLVADLYEIFHYEEDERYTPYQATARGGMTLRYTNGFPNDGPNGTFDTHLDFELLSANFAGYAFDHGSFAGHYRWFDFSQGLDAAVLDLDHLVLHKGEGTINIAGRIDHSQLQLSVLADQVRAQQIEGLSESLPDLEGSYSVVGRVRGSVDVPRMHLDVDAAGLSWDGQLLGDARAYVRLTDRSDPWVAEAARWDEVPEDEPCAHARYGLARGRWRPSPPVRTREGMMPSTTPQMAFLVCGDGLAGQVHADVALGWTDVYPARGIIDLDAVQLAPFAGSQTGIDGSLTGRVNFTGGSVLQDGTLAGSIELAEFRANAADDDNTNVVTIENDGPVSLDIVRGGLRFREANFRGPGSELSLAGGVDARGRLDVSVDGQLDLATIAQLSTEVSASAGEMRFHVDLGAFTSDPTVSGEAVVARGMFQIGDVPAPVDELAGRIRFNKRSVSFEEFTGRLGGGTLELAGSARLSDGGLQRYEFDARVQNATMIPEEGIEVGLDAETRLAWRDGERLPALTGQVSLGRVQYRRPVQLSPTLGELYSPQRAEVERYDPDDDNLAIDLRLVSESDARIQNNLMDVSVGIDDAEQPFRIVGTDQRWGVVGRLNIPRGTVRFRNTDLEVTEGEIRFNDAQRVDPQFDVLAVTEIRRQQASSDLTGQAWRVRLRAHGNMDGFQLDATSQPALSQEDLMLLLTVGMTSAEAQQLQAGDVGGTALEALSAISGVNEEVVSALGVIDDFAITTRYSPDTGRPEPMLTVGKRISERVRLSASTGLTGESRTFQTGLEWRVSDQTSFQAVYDNINRESASNLGNVGVDLHWRLEFE
ncbi:MAG: translocation/assembly module TamB domain-containing protein [Polyangiales bacterium]